MLIEIMETLLYGTIGLILMFLGKYIIDAIAPHDFPKEIKERNTAAGFMVAGIFISIAIIVRTVII